MYMCMQIACIHMYVSIQIYRFLMHKQVNQNYIFDLLSLLQNKHPMYVCIYTHTQIYIGEFLPPQQLNPRN